MFQFKIYYFLLILPSNILAIQNSAPEPIDQTRVTDLLVTHYDCRDRLNLRKFSLNRVDDCTISPSELSTNKAYASLYVRAKATEITAYKCTLQYSRTLFYCGFDEDTNHYHDRTSFYSNSLTRNHAVHETDCQAHVHYI